MGVYHARYQLLAASHLSLPYARLGIVRQPRRRPPCDQSPSPHCQLGSYFFGLAAPYGSGVAQRRGGGVVRLPSIARRNRGLAGGPAGRARLRILVVGNLELRLVRGAAFGAALRRRGVDVRVSPDVETHGGYPARHSSAARLLAAAAERVEAAVAGEDTPGAAL